MLSSADGPATSKPAAEKPSSQMMINGVLVNFPEAKLLVRKEGDKLNAFLVSNDPPEVINPTYQGNRYYFGMALDAVDDVKNLADAEFRYKAPTAESQETPNGIFLDGNRQHLEPYDIQVTFDKDGTAWWRRSRAVHVLPQGRRGGADGAGGGAGGGRRSQANQKEKRKSHKSNT